MGSHSLKTKVLSWCAKFGIPQPVRRFLGYLRKSGERSAATYSRGEAAGPLRDLAAMLAAIRSETCWPDATRSGRFAVAGSTPRACPTSGSSSTSSSSSTPSRSSAASSGAPAGDDLPAGEYVENLDTHIVHKPGAEGKLDCGRPLPARALVRRTVPDGTLFCRVCF